MPGLRTLKVGNHWPKPLKNVQFLIGVRFSNAILIIQNPDMSGLWFSDPHCTLLDQLLPSLQGTLLIFTRCFAKLGYQGKKDKKLCLFQSV